MRILQVHNRYASGQPSGENTTSAALATGLEALGHEVVRFWPESDDLVGRTKYAHSAGPLGVGPTASRLRRIVRAGRIDVALVHNVYPTCGPRAIGMLLDGAVPVVHVVHNYRHSCIAGSHRRDGAPCLDCLGPLGRLPGVRHGCYRGSRLQSGIVAAGETMFGHARSRAAVIVHLSRWMRDRVAELSPLATVDQRVIHDPIEEGPEPAPCRRDVLYVGRLAEEKGIELLLAAWTRTSTDWTLHVAGTGPLTPRVADAAARTTRVVHHGELTAEGVAELRRRTAVAVVPALWDEPFGRVAAEAHAAGQPVLATPHGALPEIVVPGTGTLVPARQDAWTAALDQAADGRNGSDVQERALANWRERFSVERACRDYATALAAAARGSGSHQ